jgi:CheY-like chemotaxis protein
MQLKVLAASDSAYRRCWYAEQLQQQGMEVATAVDGLNCVEQLRSFQPDVLLLEPSLLWGGSDGVLAVKSEDADLKQIPVVLIATDGVSSEWYQLSRYSVQGLFPRQPTGQNLAATLHSVAELSCQAVSI